MHRRIVRPFGTSMTVSRSFSMLVALAVLWVLYTSIREPANWLWLASRDDDREAHNVVVAAGSGVPGAADDFAEVVPGPNDLDPAEMAKFKSREELITDRSELRPREMFAYWQLMAWGRTESFEVFEKRAMREPAFTQLWDQPERYRAQPIRLRMHVRRVLEYEASENPLGVKTVYEATGWTDESKSYPYIVVFADKPPGLPIGPDVEAEIVFVGYFLKNMAYTAFDKRRAAPLLFGQVRLTGKQPGQAVAPVSAWETWGIVLLGGLIVTGIAFRYMAGMQRSRRVSVLSDKVDEFDSPVEQQPAFAAGAALELQPSELLASSSYGTAPPNQWRIPVDLFDSPEPCAPVN